MSRLQNLPLSGCDCPALSLYLIDALTVILGTELPPFQQVPSDHWVRGQGLRLFSRPPVGFIFTLTYYLLHLPDHKAIFLLFSFF